MVYSASKEPSKSTNNTTRSFNIQNLTLYNFLFCKLTICSIFVIPNLTKLNQLNAKSPDVMSGLFVFGLFSIPILKGKLRCREYFESTVIFYLFFSALPPAPSFHASYAEIYSPFWASAYSLGSGHVSYCRPE